LVQALVCGAGGFIGMISIDNLTRMIMQVAGKPQRDNIISGPTGVRVPNSDNRLVDTKPGREPSQPLQDGIMDTYCWIAQQVHRNEPVNA
jgi:GDP-D-mannose 3',5'-epimerase